MNVVVVATVVGLVALADPTPRIQVGLEHRTRAEGLHDEGKEGGKDEDAGGIFMRTLGTLDVEAGGIVGTLELIDARALLVGAAPSTSHIDTLDVLQANVGVRLEDVLGADLEVRLGRRTIDVGSRRLVARNEFRNTINTFTGLDVGWSAPDHALRAFIVTPVRRLPDDTAWRGPGSNDWQPDVESGDLLVGLSGGLRHSGVDIGITALWIDEGDDGRRLLTPSILLREKPRPGHLDFAIEVMPQLGAVTVDGGSRQRRAFALHASVGQTFDVVGRPRVAVAWDHASGDVGGDAVDERFDPLFGARRFELGPTGLFGPLARSNLSSPGARLELSPGDEAELLFAGRLVWQAMVWGTGSGDAAGTPPIPGGLLEARVRAWPRGTVVPELGAAVSLPGADNSGGSPTPTFFAYAALVARFRP